MNWPLFDEGAAPLGSNGRTENHAPDSMFARLRLTPPVRRNAPQTSRIAADRIAGHAPKQRAAVLAFIESRGRAGATDAEIATGLRMVIQSVNPRRGELATLGEIALNGQRRPTPSNRPARVWVARAFAPKPGEGATR